MAGIEDGISAALAYAADNAHGYELQSRDYDLGTDCAGLVRLYAAAVEGVELSAYPDFHTWNEVSALTARGWSDLPFDTSSMRRGDVLLRALGDSTGHTVVYLGDGYIVGAEGNWDGKSGDGSGTEVTKRTYYPYDYNHILRPPSKAEDAVKVMEDHDMNIIVNVPQSDDMASNVMFWVCGDQIHDLTDPEVLRYLQMVYKAATGEDMPTIELSGSRETPEAQRFIQAVRGGIPSADIWPAVDMLPARSEERADGNDGTE